MHRIQFKTSILNIIKLKKCKIKLKININIKKTKISNKIKRFLMNNRLKINHLEN